MDNAITSRKYNRKADEAKRLGVGVRTLERWMKDGILPYHPIGRIVLFNPVDVDRVLETRWRKAAAGDS